MNQMGNKLWALVLFAPFSAMAAVDTTAITDTVTDVAAVGTAVFGVLVAVKAIKLVRRAL